MPLLHKLIAGSVSLCSFYRRSVHRQGPGVRAHLHECLLLPAAEGESAQ